MTLLPEEFYSYRHEIEDAVRTVLKKWEQDAGRSQHPPSLRLALSPIKYALESGKRLRPVLTLAVYESLIPLLTAKIDQDTARHFRIHSRAAIISFALALEFIHSYSLLHDDLPAMDDDALRRGRPATHIVFGEAQGILAGDSLLTAAFSLTAHAALRYTEQSVQSSQTAHRSSSSLPNFAAAMALIADAAGHAGMIAGQIFDMDALLVSKHMTKKGTGSQNTPLALSDLETCHDLKTGCLIRAATLVAPTLFHADPSLIAGLRDYATSLGLLFQLTDDILDATADTKTLGKPAQSDIKNHKVTSLSFLSLSEAHAHADNFLAKAHRALDALESRAHPIDLTFLKKIAKYVRTRSH